MTETDLTRPLNALHKMSMDLEIFKAPTVPPIRKIKRKAKVLDEDTYVEEMAKIIQRDFFPDLEKLNAQNEFLDATERKDHQKLRELYIKYSGGQRPPTERYASPATFETPHNSLPGTPTNLSRDPLDRHNSEFNGSVRSINSFRSDKSKSGISNKYSLDTYLAAYTSEDNDSFEDLMEDMGNRSKAKFAEQLQIEYDTQLQKLTASNVPSIEQQADQSNKPEELDTWSYRAKNYIMYVPDGQPPPEDALMRRQEVVHGNTRLEADPFDYQQNKETITRIAKSQEKILSGRIGVDGSTLLDSKSKQGLGSNNTGFPASTENEPRLLPMPMAHSLVRTPSPCPGAPGESPLMTWGQIEGTPFRLDGGDTPLPGKGSGTSFKMSVSSKREQIALALAEKAGQRHRAEKQKAMEAAKRSMLSPSPRMTTGSTVDRLASMSPAAQRLATTQLKKHFSGTPSPKLTPGTKTRGLTPLLRNCKSKSGTPVVSRRKPDTPLLSGHGDDRKSKKNLTDDLLQINLPKRNRLKASDFFQ